MKKLLSVLIAAGVGFAAAAFIVTTQKNSAFEKERAKMEADWRAERERLEAEAGKRKPGKNQNTRTEVAVVERRSADEILKNLLTLKPIGTARISIIRKIVHELEDLAQLNDAAVPPIREFL